VRPRRPARPPDRGAAPGVASRALALDVLLRVDGGAFSNLVLPGALARSGLPPRERAFATDLVYGTLRWRRTLDHHLAPLLDRPVDRLDPAVRAALRLGAHQLVVGGVAPHAAVGATVAAAGDRLPRARGYVNAVLRRLAAEPPAPVDPDDLGVACSQPDWLVQRFLAAFGPDGGRAAMALANEPPPVTLRVNRRRATVDEVEAALVAAGATVERGELVPDALVLRHAGDPGALDVVRRGLATPQDQGSQAIAELVGATAGERVLDVAAAPGGKAAALAEAVGDDGLVVASDLRPGRVGRVAEAARRLGLGALVAVAADGTAPAWRDGAFDRVLVDAPCSGLGVLRRRAEARWRIEPDDVTRVVPVQRALLGAAAAAVRPGGVVVYAVCTFTAEETVEVDAWAADALPGLEPVAPPGPPWVPSGRGALLAPTAAGTDAMWAVAYRRPG
jgi:16S rRNA (cytosine967-C5)-methyltransferase